MVVFLELLQQQQMASTHANPKQAHLMMKDKTHKRSNDATTIATMAMILHVVLFMHRFHEELFTTISRAKRAPAAVLV